MLPNYVKLPLYITGLVGVGYITSLVTSSILVVGSVVAVAHWLKPYKDASGASV